MNTTKITSFFNTFFVGVILLTLTGCWDSQEKKKRVIVVNVLDKQEYDDCHIPSSINVSIMDVPTYASSWSKDDTLVFYCSNYMCTASGTACKMLKKQGFTNVYAYEAGMAGWYQSGLACVGPSQSPYLSMENRAPENKHSDIQLIETEELKALLEQEGVNVTK